ncbi:response regulator [Deltaproteobacteria bacterium TL4]
MKTYDILVVDNNETFLKLLQKFFQAEDYFSLTTTSTINETWNLLNSKEREYDVLIVDWMFPEIKGNEFIKKLRSNRSDFQDIPTIILMPEEAARNLSEGIKLGADYCFSRGIGKEILLEYTKSAARKYRIHKEETRKLKDFEWNSHNKDTFIDFFVGSSNLQDYEAIIQLFFGTIKRFKFENEETLHVSILLKEGELIIGRSDKTPSTNQLGHLDEIILKRALTESYVEGKESNLSASIYAAWAYTWEMDDDFEKVSGLAILVRNYPSISTSDAKTLLLRQKIRSEIDEIIAKILERVSELIIKLSIKKQLQEQKEVLEKEQEHTKKIVLFSTKEFQKISTDNDKNQEKQMELWENAIESLNDSFEIAMNFSENNEENIKTQMALWKNAVEFLNDSFNRALEEFIKLQPNQQAFLNNLTKLKAIYAEAEINENLIPGMMSVASEDKQKDIDDLLASMGM